MMNKRRDKAEEKKKRYHKYLVKEKVFLTDESCSTSGLTSTILKVVHGKEDIDAPNILKIWKNFLGKKTENIDLSFYTHIPYCSERCFYCCATSDKIQREEDLDEYVANLIEYYQYFHSVFKGKVFNNLYIGGGTPNILSEKLLEKLLSGIFACFEFTEKGEKTLENAPRNHSFEKLKIAKKQGINRVSFGVQTFNREVLRANNRLEQSEKQVEDAVKDAKKLGFDHINIDLMIGLYKENKASFIESFKKALNLNTTSISIYPLQPVGGYLRKVLGISKEKFFKDKKDLTEEVLKDILEIVKDKDCYMVGMDEVNGVDEIQKHFNSEDCFTIKKKEDKKLNKFRGKELETNYVSVPIYDLNAVLAIGRGGGSFIPKEIEYIMDKPLKKNPKDYKFSAVRYNLRKDMIRNILASLSSRKFIVLEDFKKNFKKDLLKEFEKTIQELQALKVVRVTEEKLYLDCEDPEERFVYLLFFFNDEDILNYVKRVKNKEEEKREKDLDKKNIKMTKALRKKLEVLESKKERYVVKKIEGVVVEKKGKSFFIRTKNGSMVRIPTNSETIFVESFLNMNNYYQVNEKREISYNSILVNDEVLVFFKEFNENKLCPLVQKISVN